jgi:outer membrane usher protein FimD/PapC
MKVNKLQSHFVMFNYNRMKLDDKNKTTAEQTETATTILTANYSLGFLRSGTNLSLGLNHTTIANNMYDGKTYGGSLSIAQSMFKNKLSLNWANSYMLNQIAGNDGATFNSYLSATFRPHPKHSFNLGVNYISNSYTQSETSSSSYNETRGDIRYAYTF